MSTLCKETKKAEIQQRVLEKSMGSIDFLFFPEFLRSPIPDPRLASYHWSVAPWVIVLEVLHGVVLRGPRRHALVVDRHAAGHRRLLDDRAVRPAR